MPHAMMLLFVLALLATGAPVDACEPHNKNRPLSVQRQIEGRSWRVQGYTQHHFRGRDSTGGWLCGTVEEPPSGAFTFKGWTKRSPVEGRVKVLGASSEVETSNGRLPMPPAEPAARPLPTASLLAALCPPSAEVWRAVFVP